LLDSRNPRNPWSSKSGEKDTFTKFKLDQFAKHASAIGYAKGGITEKTSNELIQKQIVNVMENAGALVKPLKYFKLLAPEFNLSGDPDEKTTDNLNVQLKNMNSVLIWAADKQGVQIELAADEGSAAKKTKKAKPAAK